MWLKYRCVLETRVWWSSAISMCHDTVIMTLSFMTLHKGCAVLTDGFVDFPMSHMGRCGRRNWFSHWLRSYTTDTGEKQGRFPTRGWEADGHRGSGTFSKQLCAWQLGPCTHWWVLLPYQCEWFAEPVVVRDCLMWICFANPSTLTNSCDPH